MVVAAQGVALAGGTAAQRQLLAAGGASLRWRTVFGLVLASTGLARVMPVGPVTGGAWQVREYRRRGAGTGPGVWAVLAGGVTTTVVLLALLLAAAAAAVIVYRVAGCWAVGAAGTPVAAALARPSPGGPGQDAVPAASRRAAAVTVLSQSVHRPDGTVVPLAATEDSTPQAHDRVTPCQGPRP